MTGSTPRLFGRKMIRIILLGLLLMPALAFGTAPVKSEKAEGEHFPTFPAIKPNVAFWKSIFAVYDRSQGVIHDTRYLDRIYDVIPLNPAHSGAALRNNKAAKKAAINRYKAVLLKLAKGKPPATPLEKKVAALFGPKPVGKKFRQAAARLRCQTGLKSHFRAALIRSGALIDDFRRRFRSHGLPEDLVYLPFVESSYDFKAYSKLGAAGIWQFTRGTGRLFMDIGYVVDERRDPYISTDAAARLLKKNHAELRDWPMALTAYNHGLAGMKRAKAAKGTYENIFLTYGSRSFKFASRNFYSEFLAAREVAKNHKQYFGDLPLLEPPKHTLLSTKGFLPVRAFAGKLNLHLDDFKEINPSLRSPVYKGQKHIPKGFHLRLPAHISPKAARRAAAALYREKQKASRFHVVRKGDTAGAIARNNHVTLADLIRANGLNRRAVIYIGQNLRIPSKGEEAELPAPVPAEIKLAVAAKAKPPAEVKKPAEPAPAAPKPKKAEAPAKTAPKPAAAPQKDIKPSPAVKPGSLAPPETVVMHRMPPKPAAVSEQVPKHIPEPAPEPEAEPPGEITAQAQQSDNGIDPRIDTNDLKVKKTVKSGKHLVGIIRVEAEETLGHYAKWLDISTQKIRALNRIKYGKPISMHQQIKIPLPPDGAGEFEEKRFEFHREMEEDFFESFMISGVETYKIKNGDTLWSLCENELEVPFWLLKRYNPKLDFKRLRPAQTLRYPVVDKREDMII